MQASLSTLAGAGTALGRLVPGFLLILALLAGPVAGLDAAGWGRVGRVGGVGGGAEAAKLPAEIIEFFVRAESVSGTEHEDVRRLLRREAEACAPLIAAHLRLPGNLEGWEAEVGAGAGQALTREMSAVFAHRLLHELGREHADPILKELFLDSRRLLVEAQRQLEGLAGGAPAEEIERLLRAQQFYSGLMTRSVRIAIDMASPVLVEPILEFYEAGLEHCFSHWADYALMHSPQIEDVVPRFRAIMSNPEMPQGVREEIGRAFERYAASLS